MERREFLKKSAGMAAACTLLPHTPIFSQDTTPDLVVVQNGEPEALIRRAVETLGGMSKFVGQGDVVVIVEEKEDELFERRGRDLFLRIPIPFSVAALGGEVKVPTLDGKVKLKVPSGTQTGKLFKLRGKGLPALGGGGVGDEYVETIVWTPTNLSKDERQLFRQLAEHEKSKTPSPADFISKLKAKFRS